MATASRSIRQSVQELTPADFDLLTGIDPEIAISAKLGRVDSFTARDMTGHGGSFDKSGIAIPYYFSANTEGEPGEWAVRLDRPPLGDIGKDGQLKESRKYLWPVGRRNRFYLHPDFKEAWLSDISIPVIFVEGAKKALALTGLAFHGLSDAAEKPRFIVVGLGGVWNWNSKIGTKENADGTHDTETGPLLDFNWIRWDARPVVILYDANVRTNRDVKQARKELAQHLRSSCQVAEVRYVDLPQIDGVNGVDDLLGLWDKDRVLALIEDEAYDSASFALTDMGNAERFVHQHSGKVQFCHAMGKSGEWLLWTGSPGGYWQLDRQ